MTRAIPSRATESKGVMKGIWRLAMLTIVGSIGLLSGCAAPLQQGQYELRMNSVPSGALVYSARTGKAIGMTPMEKILNLAPTDQEREVMSDEVWLCGPAALLKRTPSRSIPSGTRSGPGRSLGHPLRPALTSIFGTQLFKSASRSPKRWMSRSYSARLHQVTPKGAGNRPLSRRLTLRPPGSAAAPGFQGGPW